MSEITINLTARDLADIDRIARRETDGRGFLEAVTIEEMATELLRSHLVLVRDCGNILPAPQRKFAASKRVGSHGVSLGGGINGAS